MMITLHSQNIDISKFEIAVDFFKSSLTDASNFLLEKITKSIIFRTQELEKSYEYYKNNSHLLLDDAMKTEYENIDNATDIYEVLLKEVEEYKNTSSEFLELYQSLESYYKLLVVVPNELSFIEAKLMHEQRKLQNAS